MKLPPRAYSGPGLAIFQWEKKILLHDVKSKLKQKDDRGYEQGMSVLVSVRRGVASASESPTGDTVNRKR